MLLCPLYSKRQELQDSDKSKILCKYEIDGSLVEKCVARLTIRNKEREESYRRELREYVDSVQDAMTNISIPVPTDLQLSYQDYISVELWHSEMGRIQYVDSFSASEVMKIPYYVDTLTETLKLFYAGDSFKDYLLNPQSNENKQVTAISWLLDSVGLRTIVLGKVRDSR